MSRKTMSEAVAKRRGYVLDEVGNWRKKTILEKYYEEGNLNLTGSIFSAEQRKKAGELLARDYYLGNYHNLQSVKVYEVNIRTTGEQGIERALYYKERYLQAMKYVPFEFWNVVYKVCIADEKINPKKEKSDSIMLNKHNVYHLKMLLCFGLDRLANFYFKKSKKSS